MLIKTFPPPAVRVGRTFLAGELLPALSPSASQQWASQQWASLGRAHYLASLTFDPQYEYHRPNQSSNRLWALWLFTELVNWTKQPFFLLLLALFIGQAGLEALQRQKLTQQTKNPWFRGNPEYMMVSQDAHPRSRFLSWYHQLLFMPQGASTIYTPMGVSTNILPISGTNDYYCQKGTNFSAPRGMDSFHSLERELKEDSTDVWCEWITPSQKQNLSRRNPTILFNFS